MGHVAPSLENESGGQAETAAHTPGPWVRDGADVYAAWAKGSYGMVVDYNRSIAANFDKPQAIANARLIAAAPELLAALIDLHEKTVVGTDAQRHAALDAAWAAITKATTR